METWAFKIRNYLLPWPLFVRAEGGHDSRAWTVAGVRAGGGRASCAPHPHPPVASIRGLVEAVPPVLPPRLASSLVEAAPPAWPGLCPSRRASFPCRWAWASLLALDLVAARRPRFSVRVRPWEEGVTKKKTEPCVHLDWYGDKGYFYLFPWYLVFFVFLLFLSNAHPLTELERGVDGGFICEKQGQDRKIEKYRQNHHYTA
jgi:hypothetical protein